ncbi:PWWP domain-containing protein 2B isoform X2 [Engraulis encrasicolus]|uniref:PWWP domain-containing protein 2B isoform X2 n=1 Tax=Engraulis encrasicolus TaxID=184585 RepID=UPI002FD169A7
MSGLFCLPDVTVKSDNLPSRREPEVANSVSESDSKPPPLPPPPPPLPLTVDENGQPKQDVPNLAPVPVPAGQVSYPSYFEGAPFPQPLWVRHTYGQWIPQPPPRPIKHKRKRTRLSGALSVSTIRLRPRQVLCEKCKNTLNDEKETVVSETQSSSKKENALQVSSTPAESTVLDSKKEKETFKEAKRKGNVPSYNGKRHRKDNKEVPHSPVIKISYSTPQGKGEVMKIPSRVHGSVKPFCPKQLLQDRLEDDGQHKVTVKNVQNVQPTLTGLTVSIPKLKLPRVHLQETGQTPPKILLSSHCVGVGQEFDSFKVVTNDHKGSAKGAVSKESGLDNSREKCSLDLWSEDSFEDTGPHGDLTLLINFHKSKADSSGASVCSGDSLDESKSFGSNCTSPELCDVAPGDHHAAVSSSVSLGESKTVPPLTVRLHTRSMSKVLTEDGHSVSVGDVVWGKIHGFPWWPAKVLSIRGSHKKTATCETWPEAEVSWFGSPTTSLLSVAKLSPFCEFFQARFNRKKKGMYRRAIVEAAKVTGHVSPEITTLISHCET